LRSAAFGLRMPIANRETNPRPVFRECPCGYLGHYNGKCRCTPDQQARQNKPNAQLSVTEIDALCAPDAEGAALLQQVISRLNLSARAYHRVLKVARTIADLADAENILTPHIAEAVQYRRMDRQQ
jgi:magnesium chelatase family protein